MISLSELELPPSDQGNDPISAVKRALDLANVRYENIFARQEEIVVVLPGRGVQKKEAADAASRVDLRGQFYVSIMSEAAAPNSFRVAVLMVSVLIVGFAAAMLFWGFLTNFTVRGDSAPQSNQRRW